MTIDSAFNEISVILDNEHWSVLRLDGRAFTKRSDEYQRPFDPEFHEAMLAALTAVMDETPAAFAHTASDEISLFFAPGTSWFGNRLSKWLSVTSGVVSGALAREMLKFKGIPSVDAKAFELNNEEEVAQYLNERLDSAWRNCRLGYVHYGLLAQGLSPKVAATREHQMGFSEVKNYLPDDLPGWQKYGVLAGYEIVEHLGIDPRSGEERPTTRRRLTFYEETSQGFINEAILPHLLISRSSAS
jgi:tRNA(His) 5'-end guanylyltransferase